MSPAHTEGSVDKSNPTWALCLFCVPMYMVLLIVFGAEVQGVNQAKPREESLQNEAIDWTLFSNTTGKAVRLWPAQGGKGLA